MTFMTESSLDLFVNHHDDTCIDDLFSQGLQQLADEVGVTLEYYLEEFM